MKVIVQTAALQEALNLAGSIVAPRTPKPVLQCVKLVAAESKLTLLATDLEAACRYQIAAVQVEQEGESLIPAARLAGIVRESTDEESLTLETEKEACHVRSSAGHFKIFGYDPAEYPEVPQFGESCDFQVPANVLAAMINRTLFATAKTHSHYAISGVRLEVGGKKLTLVATDGHRLALARGTLKKASAREVAAIVPGKLMSLVQRVAGDTEEMLDVKVLENQILIRTARAVLVSTLVQGNFPKYTDLFAGDWPRKATINTAAFAHRIRQAALLTNQDSRGIRLNFQADHVVLSSHAPETGEAEVRCPVKLEGEGMDIGFDPNFLIDALNVVGVEEITFEMNAPNKAAVLKAGSDFLYVLMPVDLG